MSKGSKRRNSHFISCLAGEKGTNHSPTPANTSGLYAFLGVFPTATSGRSLRPQAVTSLRPVPA